MRAVSTPLDACIRILSRQDACAGSGVSWAVACASTAGVRAAPGGGSVAQSAEARQTAVVAPFRLLHGMGKPVTVGDKDCLLLVLCKWHKT
jgi:hypothetical protein